MKLTQQLLDQVINIAKSAGEAILNVTDKQVMFKEDKSPLTIADQASNEVIEKGLAELGDTPIVSEESISDEHLAAAKAAGAYWLVDPLDGTKEFIKGSGEYTVNIALIENGKPVLGVVYAPALKRLYYAMKGHGAYRQEDSDAAVQLPLEKTDDAYRVVVSRSHLSPETETFLEGIKAEHGDVETTSIGSSLKMCLVAENSADIYPRLGPTMLWDTAAAHCVVNEAGRGIFRFDQAEKGSELEYDLDELRNGWFVCQSI